MFGLARLQVAAVVVAVLAVTHVAAWSHGWLRGVASESAKWQAERVQLLAAAEARARILREQGDALAAELERARANVRVEYVERIRTVYRTASAARQCLSADVTAALNRQPIRETVERPGEPARRVDPPAPPGGTSELAAAEWIAQAQAAHEQCRGQVAALAAYVRRIVGSER